MSQPGPDNKLVTSSALRAEIHRVREDLSRSTGVDFDNPLISENVPLRCYFALPEITSYWLQGLSFLETVGRHPNGLLKALLDFLRANEPLQTPVGTVLQGFNGRFVSAMAQTLDRLDMERPDSTQRNSDVANFAAFVDETRDRLSLLIEKIVQDELDEELRVQQGRVAARNIADAFDAVSGKEARAAEGWRAAAVAVALAAAAFGVVLALRARHLSVGIEVTRAAVAVPGLLIAAWLSAEARDHRRAARRAGGWSVLLQTLGPFTEQLESRDRNKIMLDMAANLFREPQLPGTDAMYGQGATELVQKITELVRASRDQA